MQGPLRPWSRFRLSSEGGLLSSWRDFEPSLTAGRGVNFFVVHRLARDNLSGYSFYEDGNASLRGRPDVQLALVLNCARNRRSFPTILALFLGAGVIFF